MAHALLTRAIEEFPKTGVADLSQSRRRKLMRDPAYRSASKAWRYVERAAKDAERGRDVSSIHASLDKALDGNTSIEVTEGVTKMRELLANEGPTAVIAAWPAMQPSGIAAEQ